MYRMFIKIRKKELIDTVGRQGGGFIPAEIMVCHDFEMAVPHPEERECWCEIKWVPENAESAVLHLTFMSSLVSLAHQFRNLTKEEAALHYVEIAKDVVKVCQGDLVFDEVKQEVLLEA